MTCSVDGCSGVVRYTALCLCQKHYFRQWRNGTVETKLQAKKRELGYTRRQRVQIDERGYQRLYEPLHPLCDSQGYVYEHRKVVFDAIGNSLCSCELCGRSVNWGNVHIDHIDNNPRNNIRHNLRPLCRSCNTRRDYPEAHTMKGRHSVEIGGVTLTANEWGKLTDGYLTGSTIIRRIKSGMTHEQALMSPKLTHHTKAGPVAPYTQASLVDAARRLKKEKE